MIGMLTRSGIVGYVWLGGLKLYVWLCLYLNHRSSTTIPGLGLNACDKAKEQHLKFESSCITEKQTSVFNEIDTTQANSIPSDYVPGPFTISQ